jgi:hypothetical protein
MNTTRSCIGALMLVLFPAIGRGQDATSLLAAPLTGVRSIHYTGSIHSIPPNKLSIEPGPVPTTGTIETELDEWFAPPRRRQLRTEYDLSGGSRRKRSVHREYYDETSVYSLFPEQKVGVITEGAAGLRPPRDGYLHAVGFLFPKSLQTSLAQALKDRTAVVEREPVNGEDCTRIAVDALPVAEMSPGWVSANVSRVSVRVWITNGAKPLIRKWALYLRGENLGFDEAPVPELDLKGHFLYFGFVALGEKEVGTGTGTTVRLPTRVRFGNGLAAYELTTQSLAVNEHPAADTFRPSIPTGYAIRRQTADEAQLSVVGGHSGQTQRVGEITQQARDLLQTGTRPESTSWTDSLSYILAAVAGVLGLLGVFVVRKRRSMA